jgi:hypothetical protein
MKYTQTCYWSGIALPKLSEEIIMNAFGWYNKTQTEDGGAVAPFSSMLFELFCTTDSKSGRHASAWPRPKGFQHLVLLQSGAAGPGEADAAGKKLVLEGPDYVLGKGAPKHFVANALEDFHDVRAVSVVYQQNRCESLLI